VARLAFAEPGTQTSHRFDISTTRIRNIGRDSRFSFGSSENSAMTKSGFFGAASVLVVSMASPVMAQDATQAPGVNAQTYPWAVDRNGRVATGVGATGTADAVATAPVRDSYAYVGGGRSDDDYAHFGDRPVSRRTTCGLQSGATYMGPDGRWYPC
jgi:hypothetical protein